LSLIVFDNKRMMMMMIYLEQFTCLMDWFHGFYPARVRKSLALKTLVSAAD